MVQRRPAGASTGCGPSSAKGSEFRPARNASICASICDSGVCCCREMELSALCSGTIQVSQRRTISCHAGIGWMPDHVHLTLGWYRGISQRTRYECATPWPPTSIATLARLGWSRYSAARDDLFDQERGVAESQRKTNMGKGP